MSVQLMTPNERKARRLTPEQKLQILKNGSKAATGMSEAQQAQKSQEYYRAVNACLDARGYSVK